MFRKSLKSTHKNLRYFTTVLVWCLLLNLANEFLHFMPHDTVVSIAGAEDYSTPASAGMSLGQMLKFQQ